MINSLGAGMHRLADGEMIKIAKEDARSSA
jgi:hypothetical protein